LRVLLTAPKLPAMRDTSSVRLLTLAVMFFLSVRRGQI
jgi:hypothetical protein